MSAPIAVCTSDLHLAKNAWARHPSLWGDAYYSFSQIIDYCVNYELDLFLAGDVLDKTRPDPTTIFHVRKQLDRMERQGLTVYFVQGQHELDRKAPWLSSISPCTQHIHKTTVNVGDINFYGLDWLSSSVINEELAQIPDTSDVLVAHQVWSDFMGSHIVNTECSFTSVPHAKLVLTGDYHKHLTLNTKNSCGEDMLVLSPGSICLQSITEPITKAFFILSDDLSVTSIILRTRDYFRFEINTEEELNQFIYEDIKLALKPKENVPEELAKNILYVIYDDSIKDIYKKITSATLGKAHLFLKSKRVVEQIAPNFSPVKDVDLEKCLESIVKKDSKIYGDILLLLNSQNCTELLNDMYEAHMQESRT